METLIHLGNLSPTKGSRKNKKRIGRGTGSGQGCTAGKGNNGQKSRSGYKRRYWFEGGQMPLQRRVPKYGFTNIFRKEFQVVNLDILNNFDIKVKITPEILKEHGIIKKLSIPVKILGRGEITRAIEIESQAFSKSAVEKIEKAGGKVLHR